MHSLATGLKCKHTAETNNYVIEAKHVPSLRHTKFVKWGHFEQKNGFLFLFIKIILSFHDKDIISYRFNRQRQFTSGAL